MTDVFINGIIVFIIAGYVAGCFSAMFGIGGGLIAVPVMFWMFRLSGLPAGVLMHLAVGTSLAIMIVTTARVIWSHYQLGNFRRALMRPLFPWILLGTLIGSVLARFIEGEWLRLFFIAFICYVIFKALTKKSFTGSYQESDFNMPPLAKRLPLMVLTGMISVWLGIGGSVFTVPFLRKAKMPMVNATAAAVALSLAVSVPGMIGYIWAGWGRPDLPAYTLGYVDLVALLGFSIGSLLGVPLGAKIATRMADQQLARAYIVMLVCVLITMII